MKRWGLLVAVLYALILILLTLPVILISFYPELGRLPRDFHDGEVGKAVFSSWFYWSLVGFMALCQAALLLVPVRAASRRPVKRRHVFWLVLTSGFLMGCLVIGALLSIDETIENSSGPGSEIALNPWSLTAIHGIGVLIWIVWTIVFFRLSRGKEPMDVVTRQCRRLLKGSIAELLVAVPSHIIARERDYCCAGAFTFIGISCGLAVLLASFGPGVFFLFVERWKRLHPQTERAPAPDVSPSSATPSPEGRSSI